MEKVLNIASYAHMYVFECEGRKIIHTLEKDKFYIRIDRVEIPASITATDLYRKFAYDYKNGIKELDDEHHYRLEKIKVVGLKL